MSKIPERIDFDNDVKIVKLTSIHKVDNGFECKKPDYTEYYKVHAFNDMMYGIGKTWLCTYKSDTVIGFISVAMSHMKPERHESLMGKGYGNIPALLIGHLATRKDYEKKGVGTRLIAWAIKEAVNISDRVGCRIVMLSPENDQEVLDFYKKRGFTYVPREGNEKEDAFFLDIHRIKKLE